MAREFKCFPQGLQESQCQALAIIAQHSGYRVKGMASELGCSCRWLEIYFQQRLGLTPHAWLAQMRNDEIQRQLAMGVAPKLVCQMVGLSDPASFCHVLKRYTGCTLRDLRHPSPG